MIHFEAGGVTLLNQGMPDNARRSSRAKGTKYRPCIPRICSEPAGVKVR